MTDLLTFTVPGEPVGKMRARTFVRNRKDGSPFVTTMTPDKTRGYESKVKTLCALAVNAARWTATRKDRFAITLRVYRTHEGAGPDLDNVIKCVGDSIQGDGLAMPDDRYIRSIEATMGQDAARPRVEVEIRRMRVGELRRVS